VLRLDVVAMPLALARLASILARRRFDVLTMDVAAPVDGLRRITIEVDTADEIRLGQLVTFLSRSLDVVKVVRLPGGTVREHVMAAPPQTRRR
jgi:acetolactate synthase-1/3 small subunit